MIRLLLISFGFAFILTGCDSGHTYAPVIEADMIDAIPETGSHRVMRGETLYQIAWRYGLDYRYVAERNQIKPPYAIHPGEVIYLSDGSKILSPPLAAKPQPLTPALPEKKDAVTPVLSFSPQHTNAKWVWPAKGKVVSGFSSLNKGLNIAGHEGEPIYAAAAGKVVYCGNGLRGYGNLIILKHNSLYLSAYAHNRVIFVKEGQSVAKGQKIAEMGNTGSDKVMLHFEIRRAGKPVNPLSLYR